MLPWLNQPVLGNPLSDYALALVAVLVAFVLYFIVLKLLASRWLRSLAQRQEGFGQAVVKLTRAPLKTVLTTGVVWVVAALFDLPSEAELLLQSVLLGLVAVSVAYVLVRAIDAVFAYLVAKSVQTQTRLDDQLYPILRKTAKVFVVLITALLVVQNWGYDISALLAGLGIGGLALALAAQDTVSNLFGAIAIFIDRPFQVGDMVSLEGYSGTVESIGLRSTRLRTFEGTCVTLPNSLMTKAKIENLSNRTARRNLFTVGLTYETPLAKVKRAVEVLKDVIGQHPDTDNCRVYFSSFGESALNIEVQLWTKRYADYDAYVASLEQLNLAIKERFDAEGIEMAYPSRTVYLHPVGKTRGIP